MVKKIVLTKKMDSEVDNLKGEFLSEDYMDTLIDFDCDVFDYDAVAD